MTKRTITTIIAVLLIVITTPIYLLIFSVSLNFFDTTDVNSLQPWLIVGGVSAISAALLGGSLYGSLRAIRGGANALGLAISLTPLLGLAVFWAWLMQQSFGA